MEPSQGLKQCPTVIGLPEVPTENVGNVAKFCAFTMAWKHFHYISEVSGLIQ